MYLLIMIGVNGARVYDRVSFTKKKLVEHLKQQGYYYSKKQKRYVCKTSTRTAYLIQEVDVLEFYPNRINRLCR